MINSVTKAALMAMAMSAARVQAQDFSDITAWSVAACPPDPNDPEALSLELAFSPQEDENGNKFSGCMKAEIGQPDWPRDEAGKYTVWVDAADIEPGCSLLFYKLPGSEVTDPNQTACDSGLKRIVSADSSTCGKYALEDSFGYAYCCGALCTQDIRDWPAAKKRSVPEETTKRAAAAPAKDVTKVKSRNVFEKRVGNPNCKIEVKGDTYTKYGRAKKMGEEFTCEPSQTTCGQSFTYTSSHEISTSTSIDVGAEMGWSEFVVAVMTFNVGIEFSDSESESTSVSTNIAPEPGSSGYPTFTPLYICKFIVTNLLFFALVANLLFVAGGADVDMGGDCSREALNLGDGDVCVPKYTDNNRVDGKWEVVITG